MISRQRFSQGGHVSVSATPSGWKNLGDSSGGFGLPLPLRFRGALQPPATFSNPFGVTEMPRKSFRMTHLERHAI